MSKSSLYFFFIFLFLSVVLTIGSPVHLFSLLLNFALQNIFQQYLALDIDTNLLLKSKLIILKLVIDKWNIIGYNTIVRWGKQKMA